MDIIFFSGIEWHGQNRMPCHHLVERLSKHHRVFYINNFGALRDLNLSRCRYKTLNDLRENPPDYDVYICGSDQIWNPSEQHGLDPACFLNFGPKVVKKFSSCIKESL